MKGIRFVLALALIAVTGTATAAVYTWKDASGRVHFSDTPPPNSDAKSVKGATGSSVAETEASQPVAKTWQEKEQESRQKKAEQAQADEKKKADQARAAEKERYCASLRKNIAMLERGGRVGSPNESGEFEFYTDEQMAAKAEQARAQLARDCK
jgi:hypothetical protein